MDEQLINEYINNLANQVNALTQENILLKTRLAVFEKREQEKAKAQTESQPAPQEKKEAPSLEEAERPPLVSKEE
tara:strand:- start:484 stop:708 length:225 start_codon:yes stop_codon:yes gene_type:complete